MTGTSACCKHEKTENLASSR
jgi:hypothetical protein